MSRGARLAMFLLLAGCGARTALDLGLVTGQGRDASVDAGFDRSVPPGFDSGEDAGFDSGDDDSGFDAGFDSGDDDGGFDSGDDGGGFDAGEEAGFDAIAPFDAFVGPDSGLRCADGGLPTAYLLDESGGIHTFSPTTLATTFLGTPTCDPSAQAWTLTVGSNGKAYIVYELGWTVYEVDLATLACKLTPLDPRTIGIPDNFGISVSRTGAGDHLFVIGDTSSGPILGVADLTTFALHEVGPAVPAPSGEDGKYDMQADLTGHLFAFTENGFIEELSAATGQVLGVDETGFAVNDAWAIMTYQAQVYLFANSQVARYDFASQSLDVLGNVEGGFIVVGASAVPCQGGP